MEARLNVADWMAYGSVSGTSEPWVALRSRSTAEPQLTASTVTLPPLLRRRITQVGQMAFKAAFDLSLREPARFVFCSRHGEFQRTLNILKALAASEELSPAEFSLSVHNALAGLLSITRHNAAGHSTIAAGEDSFRSGLIEAVACLMERPAEPILLVYADEPLPEPYAEICGPGELGLALALLLTAPRHDDYDVILSFTGIGKPVQGESGSEQALAFIRFLQRSEGEARSRIGADHGWRHA